MKLTIKLKTTGDFTNAEGGEVLLSYARQLMRERAERDGKIAGPPTITTSWSNGSQERDEIFWLENYPETEYGWRDENRDLRS